MLVVVPWCIFMCWTVRIFCFLSESVPGNIRTADFFISFMRRLIDYMKMRLTVTHAVQESPAGILKDLKTRAFIDRKPLRLFLITLQTNNVIQTILWFFYNHNHSNPQGKDVNINFHIILQMQYRVFHNIKFTFSICKETQVFNLLHCFQVLFRASCIHHPISGADGRWWTLSCHCCCQLCHSYFHLSAWVLSHHRTIWRQGSQYSEPNFVFEVI